MLRSKQWYIFFSKLNYVKAVFNEDIFSKPAASNINYIHSKINQVLKWQNMMNVWCCFEIYSTVQSSTGKWFNLVLMQSSIVILNSPSSRIIKDSTPFQHQIFRCINLGIGESSPKLFLNMVNLYPILFWISWTNVCNYSIYMKVNLDLENTNQLDESSPNFISANGESLPICFGKKVNWWWILTQWVWWKGEHYRWRLMRVG